MKFSEFRYVRPDMGKLQEEFERSVRTLKECEDLPSVVGAIQTINKLRDDFSTAMSICYIRYCMNTKDEFYSKEKDFFDEVLPLAEKLLNEYYEALLKSKFKDELKERFGDQLFNIADVTLKTFSPELIEDMVEENKLGTNYSKIISSARINFDGKELTLPQLKAYELSSDRETRRRAAEARYEFLSKYGKDFDQIYDQLVAVRDSMAKKLSYRSFTQMGYYRLKRLDYDQKDVAKLRKAVEKHVVPRVQELRKKQRQLLGIERLKYYDRAVLLKEGNPRPKGSAEEIVLHAKRMYEEMSSETAEFFNFMLVNELMDLLSREGKYPGGFCDYIPNYKSPFIFANFNGTEHDVEVLTHEAGHAFQVYRSRHFEIPEYHWPTLEACEIHSMGMEFFAWPWLELFYQEEANKARLVHAWGAFNFICYGVCVDEFQHVVYENPKMTPEERRKAWREIEKKYMPDIDYDSNEYLESGAYWHQQAHIFESPFYYIDYVIAQLCAFQFWMRLSKDRTSAFRDYVKLCDAGGSLPFKKLLSLANLKSPFEEDTIESIAKSVHEWIEDQISKL